MVTIIECAPDLDKPTNLLQESNPKLAIEHLLNSPVEACSEFAGSVVSCSYHALMAALHAAFVDHRPFVLSPDMIWLLIVQGFANHVNQNSEEMRSHFVSHEGKKELRVIRDDFIKGSLENPWENVFDEFSTHIKEEIGQSNHKLIVAAFSTTGAIEKAANEIVLMDSMKAYFNYVEETLCGIPEVHLEGSHEDWKLLAKKAENLGSTYGLQWWTDRILPRLETIVSHSNGQGEPAFWRDIYKWNQGSGGPYVNGWIVDFIPYVTKNQILHKNQILQKNKLFDRQNHFDHFGISTNMLPTSLSKVPFIWDYYGTDYEMEFIAGFTSFTQEENSFAVRPKIGWAVRDKPHKVISRNDYDYLKSQIQKLASQ